MEHSILAVGEKDCGMGTEFAGLLGIAFLIRDRNSTCRANTVYELRCIMFRRNGVSADTLVGQGWGSCELGAKGEGCRSHRTIC